MPRVTVQGQLAHRDETQITGGWAETAQLMATATIPIYEGGRDDSQIRQAKETLAQRRIELDSAQAQVRQAVISAWGTLDAAKAQVEAAQAQVAAEQLVLSGVIEERKVGQRTTLDVLNAQQELLNARVSQVQAQHDKVVAAHTLLGAIGGLDAVTLHLSPALQSRRALRACQGQVVRSQDPRRS